MQVHQETKPVKAKAPKKTKAPSKPVPQKTAQKPAPSAADNSARQANSNARELAIQKLRNINSELDRLEEEKKLISDDISEIYKAAKNEGFDTDALRELRKRMKMSQEERDKLDAQVDLYENALMPDGPEDDVRDAAFQAASSGAPITANPYMQKDPRKAKWDAAWRMQMVAMAADDNAAPANSKDAAGGASNTPTGEAA